MDNHQPVSPYPILRHSDRVTHAIFSPDGHRIATTCTDGTLRIWDLAGSAVAPSPMRNSFSQDGSRYLTITNDGFQVSDTASGQALGPLIEPSLLVQESKLSHDGRFVLAVSKSDLESNTLQRGVEVWDVATGKRVGVPLLLTNTFKDISLSSDGTCLLILNGSISQTWNVRAGTLFAENLHDDGRIRGGVFNALGDVVVTWSDKVVRVWNAFTGRECFGPLRHTFPVKHAEFSPDGSLLVTCCADDTFAKCPSQVWSGANGQPVGSPLKHGDGILTASFSPDGRRIVTASEDFTAIVWEAVTGRQLAPALKHDEKVQTAMFSPDGKWIVTASSDKTARVWSEDTGDPLTPPMRHLTPLANAKFLADGRQIITSDIQGNTRIWKLAVTERPVEDILKFARLLSGDTITPSGGLISPQPESLVAIWRQLRTEYPAEFATALDEIGTWHEFQAEDSDMHGQWYAASFHWGQLLKMRPTDRGLLARLARANEHLKSGN